jgi:hypothetical protein
MNTYSYSIEELKHVDLPGYLENRGHQPQKIRSNDYWYLSPFGDEKQPPFKVNRKFNAGYDHGIGKGGNVIDFGILYHGCSVAEVIKKLEDFLSFHSQTLTVQQPQSNRQKLNEALEPTIKVIAAKPLTHPTLCRYLEDRKMPPQIAKKYCREVEFNLNDKRYFAIGLENKSGKFELPNEHFKGSSPPKDVTLIEQNNCNHIAVFEGLFSFTSCQTLHQNNAGQLTNFLILNSLSFFKKRRSIMEKHQQVHLHLDHSSAGLKHTHEALKWNVKYILKVTCRNTVKI